MEPILLLGEAAKQNDAIERMEILLTNPSEREQVARLLFEKTASGIRQRIGSAITGISAMLRDAKGQPTAFRYSSARTGTIGLKVACIQVRGSMASHRCVFHHRCATIDGHINKQQLAVGLDAQCRRR